VADTRVRAANIWETLALEKQPRSQRGRRLPAVAPLRGARPHSAIVAARIRPSRDADARDAAPWGAREILKRELGRPLSRLTQARRVELMSIFERLACRQPDRQAMDPS
jgi:hypothetical protein